jgi:ribose transport system substrate-binding protein
MTTRRPRRAVVGIGALCIAAGLVVPVGFASTAANPANPQQWQAAVKAELAKLQGSAGSAKTKWPPIPANTPCKTPKTKPDGNLVVGFAHAGLDNSAVVQIAISAEEYLKASPQVSKVIVSDGQENPSKQISDIQSMLTQGIDLLVVDPTTLAASPAVNQVCQRGIPVVAFDRFLTPGTGVTATMYADEVQDGYNAGEAIVKKLGGKGNVVIIGGLPGVGVSDARIQGAKLAFKEAPGIKVLATAYSNYDPAKGRTIMEQYLTKYPKIDAVWADSGIQSVGIVQALQAANRLNQVKMISGGQLNQYLKLWKQLKFNGFGSTISMDVGMLAAQLGLDIATGKTKPPARNIPAPLAVIDQAHLNQYVRPAFPDSYWATTLVPVPVLKKVFAAGK